VAAAALGDQGPHEIQITEAGHYVLLSIGIVTEQVGPRTIVFFGFRELIFLSSTGGPIERRQG
ncbi:MAG: hypothetical protein AAFS03_11355, partial [Pseudomonadota bacterium]